MIFIQQVLIVTFFLTLPLGAGALSVCRSVISRSVAFGFTAAFGCIASDLLWLSGIIHIPKGFSELLFQYPFLVSLVGGSVVTLIGIDIFRRRNEKMKPSSTFWDSFFISVKNFSIIFSALLIFTAHLKGYQNFSTAQKVATVFVLSLFEIGWWSLWIVLFWFIKKKSLNISRVISIYSLVVILVGLAWFVKPFVFR